MSLRTNLNVDPANLTGKGGFPLKNHSSGGGRVEAFTPSFPVSTGSYHVWVDYANGDDSAATSAVSTSGLEVTSVKPYRNLRTAWEATVAEANAHSERMYIIHVRNTTPTGSTFTSAGTFNTVPIYDNVAIRGEGYRKTYFTVPNDPLTFVLSTAQPFVLDIGEMTLTGILVKYGSASKGASSTSVRLHGNRTTRIIDLVSIEAENGAKGVDAADEFSSAAPGSSGGSVIGACIKGFIASGGSASVVVKGGTGGGGGNATVVFSGEYNEIEMVGTPGNGGGGGQVMSVLISDMDAEETTVYNNVILGGWYVTIKPGNGGSPGVQVGGVGDGSTSADPGGDPSPGSEQNALILNSKIITINTTLNADQTGPGFSDVAMYNCLVGYTGPSDNGFFVNSLKAYNTPFYSTVIITSTVTAVRTPSITDDLFH